VSTEGVSGEEQASRIGSAAQEATHLFEAVQEWAKRTAGAGENVGEHIATGSPECQLCPVCQLIRMLGSGRPEIVQHLADAAGSVLAAVRAAMDAHEREWSSRKSSGVERIDIT
jgi:hypothetical protein